MTKSMCEEYMFGAQPVPVDIPFLGRGLMLIFQRCDHEARWLAYNPHDGETMAICGQHKKEYDRQVEEEGMEFMYNEFPEGLTEQEAKDFTWPWDHHA